MSLRRCSIVRHLFSAILATLLIVATPFSAVHAQEPVASSQTTGNVENGRRAFTNYGCSACHGYSGHGGVGPRLATTSLSISALMKYVRQPSGVMPRYATETQISDATLTDIYAFLKSIPAPPDPKSIPLLQDR